MKSYPNDIKLGRRFIGINRPCFIIAEVGSNHNKKLSIAKELIDVAAKAGVDAVKFQTVKFSELYLDKRTDRKTKELVEHLELKERWYTELRMETEKKGLIFLSTPTYIKAVDFLLNIGIKAFKIASAQSVSDLKLIAYAASKGVPLFISTGLVDFGRIIEIMDICYKQNNNQIVLLHCVSLYPVPPKRISLLRMLELKNHFKVITGYSDHSLGIHFSIAAVSLGAKVIEKHFTLSKKMKGPDHFFSLEPRELMEMVKRIREIEAGLPIRNGLLSGEKAFKKSVQLKWVAAKDFSRGQKLDEDSLITRRVSRGIVVDEPISHYVCKKDIKSGDIIEYKSLKE